MLVQSKDVALSVILKIRDLEEDGIRNPQDFVSLSLLLTTFIPEMHEKGAGYLESMDDNFLSDEEMWDIHLTFDDYSEDTALPVGNQDSNKNSSETEDENHPPFFPTQKFPPTLQALKYSFNNLPTAVLRRSLPNFLEDSSWFQDSVHFPKNPLVAYDDPLFFERLELDTLFFAFFMQPGTYQQILAAAELKRSSWGFNKDKVTWFQRMERPTEMTEEFEKGSYTYFERDPEWQCKTEDDFIFKYDDLEDDLRFVTPSEALQHPLIPPAELEPEETLDPDILFDTETLDRFSLLLSEIENEVSQSAPEISDCF